MVIKNRPVLLFIPTPPPYAGPEVASELLLRALGKIPGADFIHVRSNVREANREKGIFNLSGIFAFLRVYQQLVQAFVQHGPSVFYFLLSSSRVGFLRDSVLILTAWAFRARVVAHYRGANFHNFYKLNSSAIQWWIRRTLRFVNQIIVQADSLKGMFSGLFAMENIVVLPNGLDFSKWRTPIRQPKSQVRLLFVGHLTFAKGFYDLLIAFEQLRARHPSVELWFAGETKDNAMLKVQISEFLQGEHRRFFVDNLEMIDKRIKSCVASPEELGMKYLGRIDGDRKREAFETADVFVLPSYTEGFSMAVLEAMGYGLPIVATRVGALAEVLQDGKTGFLLPPGDPKELAVRLDRLIEDSALRKKMGDYNAARARSEYNITQVAHHLMEILTEKQALGDRSNGQDDSRVTTQESRDENLRLSDAWGESTQSRSYSYFSTHYPEAFKVVRGGMRYLSFAREFQWKSPEQIRDYQLLRLRHILQIAMERVPFYRDSFRRVGFAPDDLKSLDDLRLLPMIQKSDIREHFWGLFNPRLRRQAILCQTSGTTGEPLLFLLSRQQVWMEWANIWRCWNWFGYRPYDRVAAFRHYEPKPGQPICRYERHSNTLFFSVFDMDETRLHEYVRSFNRFGPKIVRGYPSSIYILATFAKERRLQLHSPEAIITSSETLLPQYRSLIEEQFDCPVYDWYGTNERVVSACQCERRESYHISAGEGIAEYLDLSPHGEKRPEAKSLVVTTLVNTVMPLIRYRVGDLVFPQDGTCACGRGLPLVRSILGRVDDIIITGDNRYISPIRFYVLFQEFDMVRQFQIVQGEPDEVLVRIDRVREFRRDELEHLKQKLRRLLGDRVKVEVQFVKEIQPERSGKLRNVISPMSRFTQEMAAIQG